MSKISFYPENKIILINSGITEIDVQVDLYSVWKEWILIGDNAKWASAFNTFGGDQTGPNQYAPRYFFLTNGWKVKVENNSGITFQINLYSDDNQTPFIINNAAVTNKVSDIPIIQMSNGQQIVTYNEKIYFDLINGYTGSTYPIGTILNPVNNMSDLLLLSSKYNIKDFYFLSSYSNSSITFDLINYNNYSYINDMVLNLATNTNIIQNCSFNKFKIMNSNFNGKYNNFDNCKIHNIHGLYGNVLNSFICGEINVHGDTNFINCYPDLECIPVLNISNSGVSCSFRNWNGDLTINSLNQSNVVMDISSGHIIINSGCNNGTLTIRGVGEVTDNSSGTTIINQIINKKYIEESVWDASISDHLTIGSTGYALYNVSAGATPEVIADAVWRMNITGITSEGSAAVSLAYLIDINTGNTIMIDSIDKDVKRVLGLTQENFRIKDHVYDSGNNLQSATINIYNNSSDCENDTNPLAEYSMTALYDGGGRLISYKVIKS